MFDFQPYTTGGYPMYEYLWVGKPGQAIGPGDDGVVDMGYLSGRYLVLFSGLLH